MNTYQEAQRIFNETILIENMNQPDEVIILKIEKMVCEIYNKGRRSGHEKAVKLCKNAVENISNANNNLY